MERKQLQILIMLVKSYKLGNNLLFSPSLFYNLIKRVVWGGGKVEERRRMSPCQMSDLILPLVLSLRTGISPHKLCICGQGQCDKAKAKLKLEKQSSLHPFVHLGRWTGKLLVLLCSFPAVPLLAKHIKHVKHSEEMGCTQKFHRVFLPCGLVDLADLTLMELSTEFYLVTIT